MEGDGSMHSSEERGAERSMDEYLKSIGLHRKKIAKDGSCLFRAVAEQVLHCQSLHTQVRAKCVEFLKENRESYEAFIEGDFEEYLFKLQDPQQWVGEVEINALAVMYKRDFLIFQEAGKPAVNITDNNFKDKVQLCFLNGNHYDSVYPISRVKSAALCQSILYELLYDGVFNADRSSLGPCQRAARASDLLSDDNMNVCVSSDESDLEGGDALWVQSETSTTTTRHNNQSYRGRGRGRQLPERVRRSLNPTLFRNVAYDVWHKTKRAQQKMDYSIAAGMQFTVGDRCQVRLDGGGRVYSATIREVSPNNGPVTVYLEELGTRKQVPLWSLRPPNDESSWSTVVNRDKRLSNGHGDWEERGKGRGRGKNVLGSFSSVPGATATAPASSGRVQKQNSWPPQATVEEPGGAKASRKSVSSVEFGLTEEQRLAKEEEERNVALVEIQLRDEHSFPALGTQVGILGDGGRRKGGDKRRCQGNKTKSPVEEVRTPSPSAGERPKSSTPPLSSTTTTAAAATNTTINTTTPTDPTLAAAPPVNSDSKDPNTHSSASAATPTSPPPAAAVPITRPPAPGGAAPLSIPSSASLFLTPSLPAASSPPAPHILSSSCPSSSSLPPDSSVSPPPSSSLPAPTFIAPIAPSPAAAQGFLPRSSPPVSSLPHSPSPPFFYHAAQVHEAPTASAPNSLLNIGGSLTAPQTFQTQISASQTQISASQTQISASQTQTQASLTQVENQTQPSLPQNTQILIPHMQTEAQSCPPHLQHQPQPHTEVASLPQTQTQTSVSHLQQAQYLSRCQSEVAQVQSSHPAPGASYPLTSQASGPASVQPHPHLHVQPAQPPHPSQVPHPSLSLSTSHPSLSLSTSHPSPQSQTQNTQNTQNQTESPLPPAQHPQPHPEPPSHPPPSHPPHHPQLQSAPPPHHPSPVPAAVPLQQLSQLYQDPLYPGFPQGEKGELAPTPPFSSSQSGDDLPQDLNILKFFFNLGVKAYTMHMFPPYLYLLPLQQAHTMHPKLPPRTPSPSQTPHYPSRHQDSYQYPPTSAPPVPPQYDHQAPLAEPPRPSEPSFTTAAGYPVTQPPPTHRLPWQQHQMPPLRNPGYPAGYPNPSASYRAPPPLSQGYHPGQTQGHPLYPPYPPSSLGYQSSTPEELQVSQGAMEQRQPANGDAMRGQGPGRESPAAANVANANRSVGVPGFGQKKEPGDSMTRAVLLVDPPFNNTPIITMTTMNPGGSPGSPLAYDITSKTPVPGDNSPSRGYRGRRKPPHPTNNTYVPLGPAELPGYLATAAMAESLSVGCSTEDDWDEASAGFKPTTLNYRGPRRNYRGRGRVGHDPGRGANRRRQGGEAGASFNYVQFSSSHRGRGRERGY
ncbi:OTU domain-containing protein 4 [Sebastes fasciatus]|uniref:OTU domain-containing protein 4 n=1 Tax=Sebastes fasciatus TaxID=394691 RepID=UPI003D9DCBC8